MQPSYVVCRNCWRIVSPEEVGMSIVHYPTSDEEEIEALKRLAKELLKRCPRCGDNHFIRKAAHKL